MELSILKGERFVTGVRMVGGSPAVSRPRRTCCLAMLKQMLAAACLAALLTISGAANSVAEPVKQGEWARLLVEAMGMADLVAPGKPTTQDFIDFLSGAPTTAQMVPASSSMPFPAGASKAPDPLREDREWIRAGGKPVTASYRVHVAHPGIYTIRFHGEGAAQRWRVGEGGLRTALPSPKKMATANGSATRRNLLGYFVLPRGEHEVSVEIPAGGGLLFFELQRQPFPHVRPPGGWQRQAPLTFGDKAITMIQAMELEHELPDISRWRVEREAELYDEEHLPAQRMSAGSMEKPSAGAWLRGAAEGSRIVYVLPVARRGAYSLLARVTGAGGGKVILNNLVERGWRGPKSKDHLVWRNLATVPLEVGEQALEVSLESNAGLDVMRLVYRDPSPEASLMLLEDLGFEESAPDEYVTVRAARENIENSNFQERIRTLLASFYTLSGAGIGPLSGSTPVPTPGLILTEPGVVTPTDSSPKISP